MTLIATVWRIFVQYICVSNVNVTVQCAMFQPCSFTSSYSYTVFAILCVEEIENRLFVRMSV